ncbi:hypothetical protein FRC09_011829 [Ceratobasidium sp. 395]|nr:hypothetical protein FRC09_011829 [Ceratobasidium sp. 395]
MDNALKSSVTGLGSPITLLLSFSALQEWLKLMMLGVALEILRRSASSCWEWALGSKVEWGDKLWGLLLERWNSDSKKRPKVDGVGDVLKGLFSKASGPMLIAHAPVPAPLNLSAPDFIGSCMSVREVVEALSRHGRRNLTNKLHLISLNGPLLRGGCGEVYTGLLEDGTKVAVKKILTPCVQAGEKQMFLQCVAREVYAWSKCHHRNVACLLGLTELNGQIAMLSAWMENGDLRTYVNKNPQADRVELCTQMADGLAYLHEMKCIHGDLKGPNVLVSKEGTAIITDFGSTIFEETSLKFTESTKNQHFTTLRWAAAEILDGGKLSSEADIYALGMA